MNSSRNSLNYIDTNNQETRSTYHQKVSFFKSWRWKIIVLVTCISLLGIGFYFFKSQTTLKSASAVESIKNLSTLATAQAHIKTVVSREDNKILGKEISFDFPGSKRTLFLVVNGDVTAGINFDGVTKKDITIDTTNKIIHITLPHATFIQEPSLDLENIQTFSDEGLFRSEVNWEEGFEQAEIAEQNIKEEAIEIGLLTTAEDNAILTLNNFFKNLGYTVNITFE